MPPYPLMDVKIQKYHNEPKLDGVYLRNNMLNIKDGVYFINLDEYESIRTRWITKLCM